MSSTTANATWLFPYPGGSDIIANYNDTILFNYISITAQTVLRVWCVNGTNGVTQDLASSFYVPNDGPFPYVLEEYDSSQTSFPFVCHLELSSDPQGPGVNSPALVSWHSDAAVAPSTISGYNTATTTITSTTQTSTGSSTTLTLNAVPSTLSSTPTVASATNISTPTSLPVTKSSSPNIGAIVGGGVGGVAALALINYAIFNLRRHRRNRTSLSEGPAANSSRTGFWALNSKRKADEKGAYAPTANEADGFPVAERPTSELPGSAPALELGGNGTGYHNAVELTGQ